MAWIEAKYKLTSSAPLIMHNGQMADPLNKWSILLKAITAKKTKTDADREEIAHIEFLGALYMDENGPVIPSFVVDAMIINGAKKSKEGPIAKSGCFCLQNARLEYDGPRTVEGLWNDENIRFTTPAKRNMSKVPITRPKFDKWSLIITLNFEDTLVDAARIDEWLRVGGTQIGIGDWRPQHGRFTVERLNGKK